MWWLVSATFLLGPDGDDVTVDNSRVEAATGLLALREVARQVAANVDCCVECVFHADSLPPESFLAASGSGCE